MPAVDMTVWKGRVDAEEGPRALRWHQVVKALEPGCEPGIALVGFASDEGVRRNQGRVGARSGPRAIRLELSGLAVHHTRRVYDTGDVSCEDGDLERAQASFSERVAGLLGAGHFPVGLGGGHEMAYATFVGLASRRIASGSAATGIGVVNLDAHFDLRQAAHPNSGTSILGIANFCQENRLPFRCCCLGIAEPSNTAALFDRARELRIDWRTDEQMTPHHLPETLATLRAFSATVDELYLTICLDVLPASVAPGVSAPAARGVSLEVIESLVTEVKSTGKLAAADVAELNPEFDVDNRTAKVAARLIYKVAT
jgi:formiminoglutamase